MAKFVIGTRIKSVFRRDVQPTTTRRDPALQHPYAPLGVSQAANIDPPPMVYKNALHHQDDLITEFFGGKPKGPQAYVCGGSSTRRADDVSTVSNSIDWEEPVALAKCMFMYGFFFPPCWLMGIVILSKPLRPTPEWEAGKSPEECSRLLLEMRKAEVKWARRCLWALSALMLVAGLVVMIVLLATRL